MCFDSAIISSQTGLIQDSDIMLKHLGQPFLRVFLHLMCHMWEGGWQWNESGSQKRRRDEDYEWSTPASSWKRSESSSGSWESPNYSQSNRPEPPPRPNHFSRDHDESEPVLPVSSSGAFDDDLPAMPRTFKSTSIYWDENPKYDSPLAKNVFNTDHSQQSGLAGVPIHKVPLYKALYGGITNWCLRPLSCGKQCYFILVRSFQCSVFLYAVSRELRSVDIQQLALDWNSKKFAKNPGPITSDEEKKKVVEEYAVYCSKFIQDPKGGDETLMQRITDLETELANHRTRSSTKFSPGLHRHLEVDAPKTKNSRDVNAWINRAIPDKVKQKTIPRLITEFNDVEIKDLTDEVALEKIRTLLIAWGLPIAKASEFESELGKKVIIACTLI